MEFERPLVKALLKTFVKRSSVFQVIIGPRQVGKTTIARQVIKKLPYPSVYASSDAPLPPGPEWIETQWRLAELELNKNRKPVLLVLDEIQKVRGWSETLKRLWDDAQHKGKDIRLIALGSSALLVNEGLTESLAGRFYLNRCYHWTYRECAEAFGWNLGKWLYFGGYPGAATFINDELQWKRYVTDSLIEAVVARDVLQMQKIAKPALLRHLFALAAAFPSQIFSYNKMLGQLQDAGNTTTLAHYLKLLETAFLVSGLELFSKGQLRKKGSSPKLILWNNALINALSTKTFKESVRDGSWWGRLVENAAGAHFCSGLPAGNYNLTYWRDRDMEVDFVVTSGSETWAIEVKSGRGGKRSGLERFRSKYPKTRMLVVGDTGIPIEKFFSEPAETWL